MARLVAASDGFTGAEIEQAVISGLYAAFAEKDGVHDRAHPGGHRRPRSRSRS